ncbi:MAG: peptidylprolyl isomerase [Saccharospirillum sp.]
MTDSFSKLLAGLTLTLSCAVYLPAWADNTRVVMSTSEGDILIELFDEQAPVTVANFLEYTETGFYAGTLFHRVIPDFMIQGGGFGRELQRLPTRAPIQNEADNGLRNERGTLAMARTSQINSATSQFFINVADNAFLDHGVRDFGYAVFGRVIEGMDVVDHIARAPTRRSGGHANLPRVPIVIESVTRVIEE